MSAIGTNPISSALIACILSNREIDLSALESDSRRLEHLLDIVGGLLLLSTMAVVIGLVVEYWDPIHEFIEELRRPAATFPWRRIKELAGGILVTLGVAGELGFTYWASRIETSLRDDTTEIVGRLNDKAAEAERLAGEANKYAAEIQESVAPRRLTASQRASIKSELSRFARQQFEFGAWHDTFDLESSVFAQELVSALSKDAHWKAKPGFDVGGSVSMFTAAPAIPVTGISVSATNNDSTKLASKALIRELNAIGFNCIRGEEFAKKGDAPAKEPFIYIHVLARPEGPQGEAKLRADAAKRDATNNQTVNH